MATSVQQLSRPKKIYWGRVAIYSILCVASLIALVPFIWTILAAFKTGAELRQVPPTFIPHEPTLDNFYTIFTDPKLPLGLFYRNLGSVNMV